jgi:serine/threonine-protein kinase TTK/MPS1
MRDVLHDSTTATSELTNRRRNEDRSEIMTTTNKERGLLDYVPTTNNNTENMTQSITTNVRHSRDRGSWEGVLSEYLKRKGDTPWREKSSRLERATQVRANPQSAQAWLEFLEGEEAMFAEKMTGKVNVVTGQRNGVTLYRLYELATKTLPRSGNAKNEDYLRVYLGYARQQMLHNTDDARDTFKFLKASGIGQTHAIFWCEWAAFGGQLKGDEKAIKILRKGLEANAEPKEALEIMLEDVQGKNIDFTTAIPSPYVRDVTEGGRTATIHGGRLQQSSSAMKPLMFDSKPMVSHTAGRRRQSGYVHDTTLTGLTQQQPTQTTNHNHHHTSTTSSSLSGGNAGGANTTTTTHHLPTNNNNNHTIATTTMQQATPKTGGGIPLTAQKTESLRARLAAALESSKKATTTSTTAITRPVLASSVNRDAAAADSVVVKNSSSAATVDVAARAHEPETTTTNDNNNNAIKKQPSSSKPAVKAGFREDDQHIVVNGARYAKLECIGQGGTCKVYKVVSQKRKIMALKRIRLQGKQKETVDGFIDEIKLLKKLRGKDNIVQIVDAEVCQREGLILVVLEFGEIDLAKMLNKRERQRAELGHAQLVDDNFMRLYFEQMVEAVKTIHEARIVHSDLKPANFLFVEGTLKLIDFGIAKAISHNQAPNHTNIVRDHQVGTINYMSPEAILNGQKSAYGDIQSVGRASDIWSLGCILYQMAYGHTPFSKINGLVQKLHAITDPNHSIEFPPLPMKNDHLIDLMKRCLERRVENRIEISDILRHAYLRPEEASLNTSTSSEETANHNNQQQNSGLSMQQLQQLLAQLQTTQGANGENGNAQLDINALSSHVFAQIAAGQNVSVSPLLRKRASASSLSPLSEGSEETVVNASSTSSNRTDTD